MSMIACLCVRVGKGVLSSGVSCRFHCSSIVQALFSRIENHRSYIRQNSILISDNNLCVNS